MTKAYPTAKLNEIQDRFNATADKIRNDRRFNDQARKSEIAKAYQAAQKEVQAAYEKHTAAATQRRETLRRDLFGMPPGADGGTQLSYRDANARVQQIVNESGTQAHSALSALLRDAQMSGDTLMARACAKQAFDKGWTGAVTDWADRTGSYTRGQLDELHELPDGPLASAADRLMFRVRAPEEFQGSRAEEIDYYANNEAFAEQT